MSQTPKSVTEIFAYIFSSVLGITIVVYLLRGFGILTFIPGGVIWFLLLLSIGTGILYGIMRARRY
ncbi:MAG: hypothetical protein KME08_11270 [Aphanothece sp. CMT-3BRIN-NPC111]|nr:hypothetical protein [Aphanothece sp. CMT-3BRIN-NPC111]